ncbi:hypothetical protein GCM10027280_60650 [Micromonospora polyrhachis]
MGGPWGETPDWRVCLERYRTGESGPDLGCERDRGVSSGVRIKTDGRTGIDAATDTAGHNGRGVTVP